MHVCLCRFLCTTLWCYYLSSRQGQGLEHGSSHLLMVSTLSPTSPGATIPMAAASRAEAVPAAWSCWQHAALRVCCFIWTRALLGRLCPIPARPGPWALQAELAWQQHCGAGLLQGSVPSAFTGHVQCGHLQGWGAGGRCGLPQALSWWALEATGPVSHQFRLFP